MRFRAVIYGLLLSGVDALVKGISFYGLETPLENFVCSWVYPVEHYMAELKTLGFNVFRLPFSYEYYMKGDLSKMDDFIDQAREHEMDVILDLHRIWNSHQGPTPEEGVTLDIIIDMWLHILKRYENHTNVVGHNVFNEYQGTDIGYLTSYHKRVFNVIENTFPNRYMHYACGYLWSGIIKGFTLEDLPFHDKIKYSVHKYYFSGTADERDWEESFGNEFPADKLIIGEWGWKQQNSNELDWATRFIAYLRKKGIRNTGFWTIAHSGDTDGIYFDDCININYDKYNLLKTLWDRRLLRGLPTDDEIGLSTIESVAVNVSDAFILPDPEDKPMQINCFESSSGCSSPCHEDDIFTRVR